MPPPGSRQPDQKEIDAFVAWMEAELDGPPTGGSRVRPVAGHVGIQRLTRTEYGTAVNHLLGIELTDAIRDLFLGCRRRGFALRRGELERSQLVETHRQGFVRRT